MDDNPHSYVSKNKPIYRVTYVEIGKQKRRCTRFLNATNENEAKEFALTFNDVGSFLSVELITKQQIDTWEKLLNPQ